MDNQPDELFIIKLELTVSADDREWAKNEAAQELYDLLVKRDSWFDIMDMMEVSRCSGVM